eukprot:TRINITY_DN7075_c0_g1_i1.p1 TRINITY_DN7075_c0_g1~~TRINITY_DN7075_c0_g1_i1.p1  ORF type:complete len:487 (+),score=90.54 TRINITY_DN7075_c0_g1_i1:88-1548(+)
MAAHFVDPTNTNPGGHDLAWILRNRVNFAHSVSPSTDVAPIKSFLPPAETKKEQNKTQQKTACKTRGNNNKENNIETNAFSGTTSGDFPMRSAMALTEPREFVFTTAMRVRPSKYITTEEKERRELEHLRATHRFKARPLDPRILQSAGDLGVPCVPKRPVTQPQTPQFVRRARKRMRDTGELQQQVDDSEQKKDARQSEPKRKKTGYEGRPFQLYTEERGAVAVAQHQKRLQEEQKRARQQREFKALPMPVGGPFVPLPFQGELTDPQLPPLKTEERGAVKEAVLASKLEQQETERVLARQFKASEMPTAPAFQPMPSALEPTLPEGFPLRTEERGVEKVAALLKKLRRQEREAKRLRRFKASDYSAPAVFEPAKSARGLTKPDARVRNTDERAVVRAQFDAQVKHQQDLLEDEHQRLKRKKARAENRARKALRKELVHKPQPVTGKEPPPPEQRAVQPLTEPQSPCLRTKQRSVARTASQLHLL